MDSVNLRIGEKTTVRLPGKGTAGYSWSFRIGDGAGVVGVSIEPAPAAEIAGKPPGACVDELVNIEGLQAGEATIYFSLRRAWEQEKPVLEERAMRVSVVA